MSYVPQKLMEGETPSYKPKTLFESADVDKSKDGYKPATFDLSHIVISGLEQSVMEKRANEYKPVSLDLSNVKELPTKEYNVTTFDSVKPTTVLKSIVVTDRDIYAVKSEISATDIVWIKSIINSIDVNRYKDSIFNVGVEFQQKASDVPQKMSCIAEDSIVSTAKYMEDLKTVVSGFSFKSGFFSGSIENRIKKTKDDITKLKSGIVVLLPLIENISNEISECSNEIKVSITGMNMAILAIQVLMNKVDAEHTNVLVNRITSIQLSINIALQTEQIITVKRINIDNLVNVVRDTIFSALPTFFNNIEIVEMSNNKGVVEEGIINQVISSQNNLVILINQKGSGN